MEERPTTPPSERTTDWASRSLWFTARDGDRAPTDDQDRRPPLTRERVVAAALTIIADDGAHALTMRTLATRLGVVPGALYRHVRNKDQLHDLTLDGVLAEVDTHPDPTQPWTHQLKLLAHRLRAALDDHPGVATLLTHRDPLGPHSLALAEAFLAPLRTAGFADREAGLAYFLLTDYTIGFAAGATRTSVNEQRVRDSAIRTQLHAFFRALPADRFPALAALGEHVWLDNHDERFTAGLDTLVNGLEHARHAPTSRHPRHDPPTPPRPPEDVDTQLTTDGDTQRRVTR